MRSVIIDISISADEYLKQYQNASATVLTHSRDGRSVRFPAKLLQGFVSHSGIQGSFRIEFDELGKYRNIHRI